MVSKAFPVLTFQYFLRTVTVLYQQSLFYTGPWVLLVLHNDRLTDAQGKTIFEQFYDIDTKETLPLR